MSDIGQHEATVPEIHVTATEMPEHHIYRRGKHDTQTGEVLGFVFEVRSINSTLTCHQMVSIEEARPAARDGETPRQAAQKIACDRGRLRIKDYESSLMQHLQSMTEQQVMTHWDQCHVSQQRVLFMMLNREWNAQRAFMQAVKGSTLFSLCESLMTLLHACQPHELLDGLADAPFPRAGMTARASRLRAAVLMLGGYLMRADNAAE